MLHMGYICHRSAYYGLFKPLYHIKCIRTAIKGIILARANARSADRRSEFGAPPLNPSQNPVHPPPKPQSEFGAPPLNPSQNSVHPPPKPQSESGAPPLPVTGEHFLLHYI